MTAAGGSNSEGEAGDLSVFEQLFAGLEDAPLIRVKSKGKGLMAWQV